MSEADGTIEIVPTISFFDQSFPRTVVLGFYAVSSFG